jgi:hypothetical protein
MKVLLQGSINLSNKNSKGPTQATQFRFKISFYIVGPIIVSFYSMHVRKFAEFFFISFVRKKVNIFKDLAREVGKRDFNGSSVLLKS